VSKTNPKSDGVVPVASLEGCDNFVLVADYLGDAVPLAAHRSLVDAMVYASLLDQSWCVSQSASEFYGVVLWCFRGVHPEQIIVLIDDAWVRTDGASDFSREGAAVWREISPRPPAPGLLF